MSLIQLDLYRKPLGSEWRDYQVRGLEEIRYSYKQGAQGLMIESPPRSGKTRVFCQIIKEWAKEGRTVAVTAHRGFLLRQISNELDRQGVRNGIIAASNSTDKKALVQVCSIQSMKSRHLPSKPDAFVVDEAHRCKANSYMRFLEKNEEALRYLTSGTPIRLDGQGFRDVCDKLITLTTTEELLHHPEGPFYKTPLIWEGIDISEQKKQLKVSRGEYNQKESGNLMKTTELLGDVLQTYIEKGNGVLGAFYCVDIEHCQILTKQFREAGIPADYICQDTPKVERAAIFGRMETGRTKAIFNVDILTEGWDEWRVGYVASCAMTKSHSKFFQTILRGMTFTPEAKEAGLTHCTIVDHAQNIQEHCPNGHILDPRKYTLDGLGFAPMTAKTRHCPRCGCFMRAGEEICPSPLCDYKVYSTEKAGRQIITKKVTFEEAKQEDPLIIEYRARLRWCKANGRHYFAAWQQMMKKGAEQTEYTFKNLIKTLTVEVKRRLITVVEKEGQ